MRQTTMNTLRGLLILHLVLLVVGCNSNPVVPTASQVVLRGYLYAGQPVQDIQLTSSIALTSSDTVDPPISNASIVVSKGSANYALEVNPSQPGYYFYPGSDLTVGIGDAFSIRVTYNGQQITAQTTVPTLPQQLSLSTSTMTFEQDTIASPFGTRFSVKGLDTNTVTWANPTGDYYYIVLESIDSTRQALRNDTLLTRRFISNPTDESSYIINNNSVLYTGKYVLTLYHVNKEYADLYLSRQQDTYTLNEPLTNVHNGLGVFSAFASDSLYFSVVLE